MNVSLATCVLVPFTALIAPAQEDEPAFLAAQTEDGSWRGDAEVGATGTTALVALALLGSGNSSTVGPQAQRLRRGIAYLLRQETAAIGELEAIWRALALCEAAYLDPVAFQDTSPQQRAIDDLLARRQEHGGFQDRRATGWAGFALASAEDLNLELSKDALVAVHRRLRSSSTPASSASAPELSLRLLASRWAQQPDAGAEEGLLRVLGRDSLFAGLNPEERMLVAYAANRAGGATWKLAAQQMKPAKVAPPSKPSKAQAGAGLRAEAFRMLELQAYFRYARIQGAR